MTKLEVIQQIKTIAIVPVVRAEREQQAFDTISALAAGGISVVEVTMTVPGALRIMSRLAKERPDILVGAGTVLDPETARLCLLEGANFIVSPCFNPKTIEICCRYGIAALPGALTPTEIVAAWQAGADIVKVFPASAMGGASYLRSIKAPLPHVQLLPTGGVNLDTAASFLRAGACALGVGADLTSVGSTSEVTALAARYLEAVRNFRESAR
jgi:2-dehydro-3-deoxyphosphogluconate aldolase/(4S)-4-hydroxy-2-oxoglutarate aldolase